MTRKTLAKAIWMFFMLIALGALAAGVSLSMISRFADPTLTETQLFMRHWPAYALASVGLLFTLRFWGERPMDK